MPTVSHDLGPEYPAFVRWEDGTSMPLARESRWSRTYRHPTKKIEFVVSRFDDGSASLAYDELAASWSQWTRAERLDFCYNCSWLHPQADFAEMLRFILREGDWNDWSGIASSVATVLPSQESFELLTNALQATPAEHSSNLIQALSKSGHPSAAAVIRATFEKLWQEPHLWDDDSFSNWFAFTATCCIQHLLELGAPPADFEEAVRALSRHPCKGNRDTCSGFLGGTYSWLPPREPPKFGPG